MPKCPNCGKEYAYGSYHYIHCGVIYKDDRQCYDWNCTKPVNLEKIEEKIIARFVSNSKVNSLLVYE
ncbi:MAG: hypothetical protein ACFE85_01830 [Candidatus Hodarchaeota archaeon]